MHIRLHIKYSLFLLDFTVLFVCKCVLPAGHSQNAVNKYIHIISTHIILKVEFFLQIFEKFSNVKFHGNPSSGSRVFPGGRRSDRHGEVDGRFSQFSERA
jgi:hypothetical protein